MRIRQQLLFAFTAVALACSAGVVGARQQAVPAAPVTSTAATAALDQPVPLDPAITAGRFENGLRYFIRKTRRPEQRAELRLVVDVGSIVEEDDQRGLAHFVEHMAFNGTKNFPKQETVTFLESLGMRFGPSINASTSFDETVYMLQVPTEKPEVLDRAFLILEDWAHGVTFDPAEIDKERGVIREEWRIRRGAGARMQDKQLPVMLKGSRYADRIPIGTMAVIDNFKHERLTQFYRDWYRPDLMTVVAVGDFDPPAVEKMIKAHFEPIPAAKTPRPRPSYPVADHPGTLYAIATDAEAQSATINVQSKLPPRDPRSVGAQRGDIVERLFSSMLGARFAELAQRPDAPFIAAGAGRGLFVRTKSLSTLSAVAKGNAIDKTLEVLFTETERVARFGFTPGELERTKSNLLNSFERAVNERENTLAASLANELVRHVTAREPVPGIVYETALYQRFLPEITLTEVNALARDWAPDRSRVITVSAPEKPGIAVPDEKALAAVIASIPGREITAYVDTVNSTPLLETLPPPGAVVGTDTKPAFGITEWKLANGVKVVLKPTEFRADEILFRAISYGGSSQASDADFVPASSAAMIMGAGGIGQFSLVDVRKKLTGKSAGVTAFITDYEEGLTGNSSRKDLETMFQLLHLRFTQPRADPNAFRIMQVQMKSQLPLQRGNPAFLFAEALTAALRGNHLRSRLGTMEQVEQMNLEKSLAFYKDRFGDAGDFTFVFVGSFTLDELKPLVERYIGSLPATGRKETWKDTGQRYARGVVEKRVEKGLEPKSQAAIVFTGDFKYVQEQRLAITALNEVLQARLHETLREDLGGTYGVNSSVNYLRIPVPEYTITVSFSCAPERTEELVKAVFQQVERLKAEGPTETQVTDAREKLLRDYETNRKQNGYWVTQLAGRYQSGEPVDSLFGMLEHYRQITPAMIRDAARLYLNPANHVTVTLFPEFK